MMPRRVVLGQAMAPSRIMSGIGRRPVSADGGGSDRITTASPASPPDLDLGALRDLMPCRSRTVSAAGIADSCRPRRMARGWGTSQNDLRSATSRSAPTPVEASPRRIYREEPHARLDEGSDPARTAHDGRLLWR